MEELDLREINLCLHRLFLPLPLEAHGVVIMLAKSAVTSDDTR